VKFRFPLFEEGGAGEEGTKKLVRKYKKETPGESVSEVYRNSGLGKWFHGQSAGGEPGWDRYDTTGKKVGKCGDSEPGEGKPKCLSRQKAAKLRAQGGSKAIANAVRRKRQQDPQEDRPGTGNKPINVSNRIKKESMMKLPKGFLSEKKNKPTNPDLWNQATSKARSKFDVYPSAYANAWAAKWYKAQGGGWKSTSESYDGKDKDHGRVAFARGRKQAVTAGIDPKYKSDMYDLHVDGKKVSGGHTENEVKRLLRKEDWQSVNRKDNTDGLSRKAVNAYRRENPGSKLQTAVTEKNPKGKRAARRASFCRRMKGMKNRLTSAETANDPDSRINKALRRWNC